MKFLDRLFNKKIPAPAERQLDKRDTEALLELRLPEGDGVCSDNFCPCGFPGAKVPRGGGYVILSKELVEWRKKFPTLAEWDVALASIQSQTDPAVKAAMQLVLPPSGLQPTVCCDQSPLLDIVDREIAAADARLMWKSARLPLRATPLKGGTGVFSDSATLPARKKRAEDIARQQVSSTASRSKGHYVLKCINCDFAYHIPNDFADNEVKYSVNTEQVKIACVYGQFTVSLALKEFFAIAPVESSGQVLQASISPNLQTLHPHMLSHCDPLFLIIRQSSTSTTHEYKRQLTQGDVTYVRFRRDRGIDIVGNIDVAKAEVPGVS